MRGGALLERETDFWSGARGGSSASAGCGVSGSFEHVWDAGSTQGRSCAAIWRMNLLV